MTAKTLTLYPDQTGNPILIGDLVELDGRHFDVELNPFSDEIFISGDTGSHNLSEVHKRCIIVGKNPLVHDEAVNYAFNGHKFFTFQPEDLHGKTLRIVVTEDSGNISINGIDEQTMNMYMITNVTRKDMTK
jgi:hypothetical protein